MIVYAHRGAVSSYNHNAAEEARPWPSYLKRGVSGRLIPQYRRLFHLSCAISLHLNGDFCFEMAIAMARREMYRLIMYALEVIPSRPCAWQE